MCVINLPLAEFDVEIYQSKYLDLEGFSESEFNNCYDTRKNRRSLWDITHEFEALSGMDELVDQCRPKFLIEIAPQQKADVMQYLTKYGYKLTNIKGLNFIASV